MGDHPFNDLEMSRPEHIAPPEIYYNDTEAKKYAGNSRIIEIQTAMSERAIELLNLPNHPCYILDIGCGSGLSGEVLSDQGHTWVGVDISASMLGVAVSREVEGDLFNHDMGQGLFFRAGTFDAAISISAVQWLCNQDQAHHNVQRRLRKFFQSLYKCLVRGGKAVIQFYPENGQQMEMISSAAMISGFSGGFVVDYPNSTKAKKYFLCLCAGSAEMNYTVPAAKGLDEKDDDGQPSGIQFVMGKETKDKGRRKDGRRVVKNRDWIQAKKERARKQGKKVCHDSKYSGRSRGPKF
eukprot:TRINITY_DN4474_c0_g4_i2.p1 TRINITY_DN4474_c0_g4~~TRINITY_DN4474_c0_g4_i2.p1  ORF type:complete len:305 (+),score=72.12 TRINITY_DN4474_c0_g4_i2:33-917(+)